MTAVSQNRTHSFRTIAAAAAAVILLSTCRSATDVSASDPSILFFQGSIQGGQLVVLSPDGTVRQQILDISGAGAIQPRWSPDRQRISFYRLPYFYYHVTTPGLFVINADGTDLHEIAPGQPLETADWSPDGSDLVAYSADSLVLVRLSDGAITPLPGKNAYPYDLFRSISWSPDGNHILYNGFASGTTNLEVFDVATGASRVLVSRASNGRWSPDGSRIAYWSGDGRSWPNKVAVVNSDGSNPTPLTSDLETSPDLTWSPDGKRLVFVIGCCQSSLVSMPAAGGKLTALAGTDNANYPDWRRAR